MPRDSLILAWCPIFPAVAGRGNIILTVVLVSSMGDSKTQSFRKKAGAARKKVHFKEKTITLSTKKKQELPSLSFSPSFYLKRERLGRKRVLSFSYPLGRGMCGRRSRRCCCFDILLMQPLPISPGWADGYVNLLLSQGNDSRSQGRAIGFIRPRSVTACYLSHLSKSLGRSMPLVLAQ